MEARLTWLVKLVRPVTTISWGGEWIMETKVLSRLGFEGSPVLSLGRPGCIGVSHEGRLPWQGVVNVEFSTFHEGRGTGKKTTPGGRKKNAYFLKLFFLD